MPQGLRASGRSPVLVSTARLLLAVVLAASPSVPSAAHAASPAGSGGIAGRTVTIPSPVAVPAAQFEAQVERAEDVAAAEAHMVLRDAAWAARRESRAQPGAGKGVGPHMTAPLAAGTVSGPAGPAPAVPEDYANFFQTVVTPIRAQGDPGDPGPYYANVAEPAVGGAGRAWFMAWNWGAARTPDGGTTWIYMSPFTGWPFPYSFCCDQDVVYDRGRDLTIWYRQGSYASSTGQNQIKLGVSLDGGANWLVYTLQPTNLDASWTNQWFDYPHLALSNNYLYITSNMFSGGGAFLRMVLMKMPLDALQAGAAFSFSYWTRTAGWSWTLVQGARETMYLGDTTNSGGTFTLFWQNEADSTLWWVDQPVVPWTFTNRDGSCPVLNGTNPCLRADQRITAGVVSRNGSGGGLTNAVITFFWNVREGGSFAYPYVEAASFAEATKAYVARPLIWNPGLAFHWAAAAPNERGDIGGTVYGFVPTAEPFAWAFLDDQYWGEPPGWPIYTIAGSAGGPQGDSWGDYSRVRPDYPCGATWTASVYTKDAGNVSEPRFVRFGRVRDGDCFARWYDR